LDALLKQLYNDANFEDACYKDKPLLGVIPKYEWFGGRNMPIVIEYGRPQGRSATFATAQSNAYPSSTHDFLLTPIADYGVAGIDGIALATMKNDKHAFVRGLSHEIDGILETVSGNIHRMLYRDGAGVRGTVGTSGITTTALTLANAEDVVNFEVGMEVVGAANTASALRDSGNSATVTAINRESGILTTDSNWTTQISGLTDADSLFQAGDYVSASDRLNLSGLLAWVPASAPGATAFFGVARNADTTRLGGTRYDGSSLTILEALNRGQALCAQLGEGAPDYVFMNHSRYRDFIDELGSRVTYENVVVPAQGMKGPLANVLFSGIKVHGIKGPMTVIADNACQHNYAWMLTMRTWGLYTTGPAPAILKEDGLRIQRQATADGYEVLRVGYYGNVGCKAPGKNCLVTLPT